MLPFTSLLPRTPTWSRRAGACCILATAAWSAMPALHACSDGQSSLLDASMPGIVARVGIASARAAVRGVDSAAPLLEGADAPAPADPRIAAAITAVDPQRIRATIASLVAFGTRNTLSSMSTDLPPGQGIAAAADWIESQFKEISASCGNCLEVKRDTFIEPAQGRIPQPTRLTNIYAVLRGTDPAQNKRMYLVTGHYDSRATDVLDPRLTAPGANDDASGVAVSLEAARALSKLKFPATLVFVAVAGEEQGLNGSRHLAQLAKSEGWQLGGVLNNDIVGGNTTPGAPASGPEAQDNSTVRVFSEGVPPTATPEQLRQIELLGYESDSPSRELARAMAEVGRSYFAGLAMGSGVGQAGSGFHPTLIFRADRFLRGGDHTSFNKEGFAAVRLTEWREDFNHQHQTLRTENGIEYGDYLKFVDTEYVANVARLNAATLATLASAPPPPGEVKVLTRNLDNNTMLTWQAGTGAPAGTQYRIVWRPMENGQWTSAEAVPAGATSITLPISKDNVVFGVEAVDAAGHRSLAVPPLPAR